MDKCDKKQLFSIFKRCGATLINKESFGFQLTKYGNHFWKFSSLALEVAFDKVSIDKNKNISLIMSTRINQEGKSFNKEFIVAVIDGNHLKDCEIGYIERQ